MTKIEIIEDIVNHYSKDYFNLRATNGLGVLESCVYLANNGNMCAVGRYLKEPEKFKTVTLPADLLIKKYSNNILKDNVKDHNPLFWYDMQKLHDNDYFWNKVDKSLSDIGFKYVNILKEKYK